MRLNLFGLRAADVLIDLLTDSGTGRCRATSGRRSSTATRATPGSPSWFMFLEAVQELFPFRHVIPTHQGRAAEKILFTAVGGPGKIVPNNTHFDTTRANVEFTGAGRSTCPIAEALEPADAAPVQGEHGPRRAGAAARERAARRARS